MKAWEICRKENVGKVYKDNHGKKWSVYSITFADAYYELKDSLDEDLSSKYYMSEIAELDFEEVIDWSKVPVDTKVLVGSDNKKWIRRHFAKYENGNVCAWNNGATSFSANTKASYMIWRYAKLYKGDEE